VFGREFADGTLKDLLAVPVSRTTIVLAKFIVVGVWSMVWTAAIFVIGLVLGAIIGLPQGTAEVLVQGSTTMAVTAALVIVDVLPVAWFASVGRGYLLPMGIMLAGIVGTCLWWTSADQSR
jgi:ABC-2 type transport system permease protein